MGGRRCEPGFTSVRTLMTHLESKPRTMRQRRRRSRRRILRMSDRQFLILYFGAVVLLVVYVKWLSSWPLLLER